MKVPRKWFEIKIMHHAIGLDLSKMKCTVETGELEKGRVIAKIYIESVQGICVAGRVHLLE